MSLEIALEGRVYLPLRSLPFVSSGILDSETVIQMIGNPDDFCHHDYDSILSPKCIKQGQVLPVAYQAFQYRGTPRKIARKGGQVARELPAGMIVSRDVAKEKFDFVLNEILPLQKFKLGLTRFVWDIRPGLTPAERQFIYEQLPVERSNSKEVIHAEMRQAYGMVKAHCKARGFHLDDNLLPGTAKSWKAVFEPLAPSVRYRCDVTFKDHMKALGFRWKQGYQPDVERDFLAAVRDIKPI